MREPSLRRIVLGWLPAFAYMALIWTLSSMPIAIPLDEIPFKDKGVHAVEYGVLAVLSAHAIRRTWLQPAWWRVLMFAALLTFTWGYFDELHQAFVPGRNSDAFDLLADTVGALLGAGAFGAFDRWRVLTRRTG